MPRPAARLSLLLLVALAVAPAAAGAAQLTPLPPHVAVTGGPVFAGDALAWTESRPGPPPRQTHTVVRAADGTRRTVSSGRGHRALLGASPERIASVHVYTDKMGFFPSFAWGPLDAASAPSEACVGDDHHPPSVTGRAFALRCGTEVAVHDDDVGVRRFAVSEGSQVAIAGRHAALRRDDAVIVVDRLTGEERFRVATPRNQYGVAGRDVALADDGTVVFSTPDGTAWASSAEPFAHRLGPVGSRTRIAAGRVALATRDGVEIRTLGGELVAGPFALPSTSYDTWDFDGRRLAYAAQPCALATVVVIDVTAEAAPDLGSGCGRSRLSGRRLRVDSKRWVTLTLACPRSARGGCGRLVELCPPGRPVECRDAPYAARAGETRRVRIRLLPEGVDRLRRSRRPRLDVRAAGLMTSRRVVVARR